MLLANDQDIVKTISEIEKTFGSKGYGEVQRKNIVRVIKQLTPKECRQLVDRLADARRYLPVPQEVRDEVISLVRERNKNQGFVNEKIEYTPIKCVDCYETGYMFVLVDEVETLCKCSCTLAKNVTENFPDYHESMSKIPFPVYKFKPTERELQSGKINSWSSVMWWKGFREVSKLFWEHKMGGVV